jgi:hypothetical protein
VSVGSADCVDPSMALEPLSAPFLSTRSNARPSLIQEGTHVAVLVELSTVGSLLTRCGRLADELEREAGSVNDRLVVRAPAERSSFRAAVA